MKRHAFTLTLKSTLALGLALTFALAIPAFAIVNGEFDGENEYSNVGSIIATSHPVLPTPQTIRAYSRRESLSSVLFDSLAVSLFSISVLRWC